MQRKIKNVVKNYTASEIKVREATSNDPWGPSTTLMSEISTLTFDPLPCGEMMNIIWKRLNDHGKNWRHVYKSLVLLDFLVRTGSERVVKQCKDNIIFIQTLRDFQYVENGLDCGLNVREAAKKLYDLLRDDDRLKNERHRANKSRSKFGDFRNFQSSAGDLSTNGNGYSLMQSSSNSDRKYRPFTTDEMERELHKTTMTSSSAAAAVAGGERLRSPRQNAPMKDPEMESIRPANQNEEDIQLQLALAMSKEQHEQEMKKIKSEEIKLQMAIEESKKTAEKEKLWHHPLNFVDNQPKQPYAPPSSSSSILAQTLVDPWATSSSSSSSLPFAATNATAAAAAASDPWKVENPEVAKDRNAEDLFATGAFYSTVDKVSQNSNNNNIDVIDSNPPPTRPKYPWEMGSTIIKTTATKNDDEFSEILHRPSVAKIPQQTGNAGSNVDFFNTGNNKVDNINTNNNNSVIDSWFNGNASNNIQQKSTVDKNFFNVNDNNNNNGNDSIDDLLNLNTISSTFDQQQKTKNTKKITPEEFLGPNAKLVDFDELISKPNPAKTINPFAITMSNKGVPQNPFTVKAQQEEKSKRVPLNQLQAGNVMADQSASSFRFDNGSQLQEANNYNTSTSLALSTGHNQPYNPFL